MLVIDDDERARYIVRKHLVGLPFDLIEAGRGPEGIALAQERIPHVILLDFLLQEMNREVNTMGSKADGLRVSELIISAKAELEKMREQVQNVE